MPLPVQAIDLYLQVNPINTYLPATGGGNGWSEMIQSSFLSAKVFSAHSLGSRATSQPFESRANDAPNESDGLASGASGSP